MPAPASPKIFVLDTNVILHDSECIHQFKQQEIAIPITVLEELDNFKKGNESIHFHARAFVRTLDGLSGDKLFKNGVSLGQGRGRVRVVLDEVFHKDLAFSFAANKPDHLILNCAYNLAKRHPSKEVILVSKDVNLRMKAKATGLKSQDYTTDQVEDISQLYTGRRLIENLETELVERIYEEGGFPIADLPEQEEPLKPHENVILRNGKKSALGTYDSEAEMIRRVNKEDVFGITPRNAEQTFALHALLDPDIRLVTLAGTAGTGKTLLALAAALEQRKEYRQIFLARPVVPLSNKDLGFLPGEIKAKLDPYMQPIFDNLGVIQSQFENAKAKGQQIQKMLDDEKMTIAALSYIRGRSLNSIFFIVDEAQNLTPHEVKTIITRAGEGTKIVLTGDIFQIDHPYLNSESNGLSYTIEKMQGQPLYAHVSLEKGERSELAELASHLM